MQTQTIINIIFVIFIFSLLKFAYIQQKWNEKQMQINLDLISKRRENDGSRNN